MASKKYYAVAKGRETGVFTSWKECEKQIKGFSGALYKSFKTKEEAEAVMSLWLVQQPLKSSSEQRKTREKQTIEKIFPASGIIIDSVCVDASCIGNPGDVEYKGLCTATHEVIFHKSPMPNGTNNLGEFLAIVHGLAYLKKQDRNIPIYSDSETAILWVKIKKVRTKLKRSVDSEEIFNLVERALNWLEANEYTNPILKWNTVAWGEILADFGRK